VERKVKGALYFFVDACRDISREKAIAPETNPLPLLDIDPTEPLTRKATSIILAAGEGNQAFAPPGGSVSRFTEALLLALSGYCGEKVDGRGSWAVDGEILAKAVRKLLERSNRPLPGADPPDPQISEQNISGSPGELPLLRLATVPKVKVELRLMPDHRRPQYRLYLKASKDGTQFADRGETIFQVDVPRGYYEVGAIATAADTAAIPPMQDEDLVPPEYRPDPLEATP
jgi:hypothetical protein